MDLYEHQGKELFRAVGIPTPRGIVCDTRGGGGRRHARARRALRREGAGPGRRPRQGRWRRPGRLAGARGRGGGTDAAGRASATTRSPASSSRSSCRSRTEFYTSILLDRSTGSYLAMMTAEGGMDIEELARTRPEALRRVHVDPLLGLRTYHLRELTGVLPVEARALAADVLREPLPAPRRGRRHPRRGEPARAARGRAGRRPRREGHDRRQLAVPARGPRGPAGLVPDRPGRGARQGSGPAVREARRRGRHHRQRGRPRDVDARRREAGGRRRGELPRRRRRRQRRPDGDLARGHPVRPGRARGVHQHLRRHHAGRPGRGGHPRGPRRASRRHVPIVVRLDGTNAEEGRRILAEAAHPRIVPATTMLEAAERAAALAKGTAA